MSLSADGGVMNVLSSTVVSHRATTPNKIPRSGTPQRATSAPRASSNSKRELKSSDLYCDPSILQRAPARSVSRKKQRQWENKTLFGLDQFKLAGDKQSEFLEELEAGHAPQLEIKWRNTLSELLKPENYNILKEFLSCKEGEMEVEVQKRRRIDLNSCVDWKVAELGWVNIERKVRFELAQAFGNAAIHGFLQDVELAILHFAHFSSVVDSHRLSNELQKDLLRPLKVDTHGNLQIPLCDSPFRRMLLHGVVQFYGLRSKSIVLNKKSGVKVMIVMKPKSKMTTFGEDDEVEEHLPRQGEDAASPSNTFPTHATAARCISLTQYLSHLLAVGGVHVEEDGGRTKDAASEESGRIVQLDDVQVDLNKDCVGNGQHARQSRGWRNTISLSIHSKILGGVENITSRTAAMNLANDYVLV